MNKKRLSAQDWLEHGLETLTQDGFAALKAASMTKALGVSRGSFYWHFKDIEDFKRRLLATWQQRTVAQAASLGPLDPKTQLLALMKASLRDGLELERAVRAWATHDPEAQRTVSVVDSLRLFTLESIMRAAGAPDPRPRAAFVYAASLGQLAVDSNVLGIDEGHLEALADLMLGAKPNRRSK